MYLWTAESGPAVESYGGATWKRQRLAKGVEADSCYYIANAARIIGKRDFDLDVDPPPDLVVEIDITNESLGKFPIYAALGAPEIWRSDEARVWFYELAGQAYREIHESRALPGLTPAIVHATIEQSKTDGPARAGHLGSHQAATRQAAPAQCLLACDRKAARCVRALQSATSCSPSGV